MEKLIEALYRARVEKLTSPLTKDMIRTLGKSYGVEYAIYEEELCLEDEATIVIEDALDGVYFAYGETYFIGKRLPPPTKTISLTLYLKSAQVVDKKRDVLEMLSAFEWYVPEVFEEYLDVHYLVFHY